jgi:hypothetical protein
VSVYLRKFTPFKAPRKTYKKVMKIIKILTARLINEWEKGEKSSSTSCGTISSRLKTLIKF